MSQQQLSINLEAKTIAICPNLPPELGFLGNALQHQVDVFNQAKNNDIILDLAPTGTGKTKAGLSVLLHNSNKSAIYIAPTNALITQQTQEAKKFVKDANLPHFVIPASAKEIKLWSDEKVGKRSGEKLYNLLRNPATVFPEIGENKPILLVTNPDIFYYATFFAYGKLDKSNIASVFYNKFGTVIFDEFHLYDAKQLVGLLFYLTLSHAFGYFQHNRKIVLLTATPEQSCDQALDNLAENGVKIVRINGENCTDHQIPSQTEVNLTIKPLLERDELLTEIKTEIIRRLHENSDHNGAVILDSKDHINRLADLLKNEGYYDLYCGRITGATPQAEREQSVQKKVILATSTVDVGFNFEKTPQPTRQNLDWLIFSSKDRASFWQRIGRVGRVLGKQETNIMSEAIAYLPALAWSQGISDLDCTKGRESLKQTLNNLECLNRPFLEIYWRSEAFLEIAKPLLELEESLENLPEIELISQLYQTMKSVLGGKRDWTYYRYRMKLLRSAEQISRTDLKELKKQWKYIKGSKLFLEKFIEVEYPEYLAELKAKTMTIEMLEEEILASKENMAYLQDFAKIWSASYAPLFTFRDSLFNSLNIRDPQGLLLDELEETSLDPIHLLRYYEFAENQGIIELIDRAKNIYQISFRLRYYGSTEEFKQEKLNQLTAFENCKITRKLGDVIAPTPLLKELEKQLISGVIVSTAHNQGLIINLRKQGIISYPIKVSCDDFEKDYTFFPSLSGILAMAIAGVKLRLIDNQDF